MFTVSVAAPDRSLLTLAEMKAALGIVDAASDAALTMLGAQISDMIAHECRVPVDGVTPPTLRSETVIDEMNNDLRYSGKTWPIVLARRFVTSITSVVVAGTTIVAADYQIDKGAGLLRRVNEGGTIICWSSGKIVVTYVAGFLTVPEPLKLAAITVLREQWSFAAQGGAAPRDPMVKSEAVDGVSRFEYFAQPGGSSGSMSSVMAISPSASGMLTPYKYWDI
jgi:hypothetical protein